MTPKEIAKKREQLQAAAQNNEVEPSHPLDRLAAKGSAATRDQDVEFKVRCKRELLEDLDFVASKTRYRRNGLVKLFIEQGIAEYKARLKAVAKTNGAA